MSSSLKSELYKQSTKSCEIFELIHEGAPEGFWFWNLENSEQVWLNPVFLKTLGYNDKGNVHNVLNLFDLMNMDDLLALKNALEGMESNSCIEFPVRYKDFMEREITLLCKALYIRDDESGRRWAIGTHRSTEYLDKLHQQTRGLTDVIFNIQDILFTLDVDQRHTGLYGKWLEEFGLKPDEIIGKTIYEVLGVENARPHMEANLKALEGNYVSYTWQVKVKGELRQVHTRLSPVFDNSGKVNGIIGVGIDITDELEKDYNPLTSDHFFNHSVDMLCIAGFDGYFKILNPAWSRTLGWSTDELLSRPWNDFVHPDDLERTESVKSEIVNGSEVYAFINRFRCKDGTYKWLSWNSHPNRKHNVMFGVARDETKKRQNELKVKESEAKLEKLFEHAPDAMIVTEKEKGLVLAVNKSAEMLIQKPRDVLIGSHFTELHPPYLREDSVWFLYEAHTEPNDDKITSPYETMVQSADGSVIRVEMTAREIMFDGKPSLLATFRDIEERKQMEAALIDSESKLRESESLLNEAQRVLNLGSWSYDLKNFKMTWSDGLYNVFDIEKGDFKETYGALWGLIDVEDREHAVQTSQSARKSGDPFHLVYRITTTKREKRYIEEFGFAEQDSSGKIARQFGTVQNVTERVKLQNDLINSDRIFKYALDMLCIVGFDGYIKAVNPAWTKITGWTTEELLLKPFQDFLHPEDAIATADEFGKVLKGQGSVKFENRYLCKDGSYKWLSWSSYPYIKEQKIYAVARDVTEQKNIEKGMNRLYTAVEQSPASIVITDLEGTIEYANPAFTQLTGYTLDEAKGSTPRILKSGHHSMPTYEQLWNTITSGKVWSGELRNKKKNGELYWERARISPVIDNQGNIINYLAIKEDISHYKSALNKLAESELYHRTLIQTLPDLIFVINSDGVILDYKTADQSILYKNPDEFMNKGIAEVMPLEIVQKFFQAIEENVQTGIVSEFEYPLKMKDKEHFYNAKTAAFGEGKFLVTIRDVTIYKENLSKIKVLLDTKEKQNHSLRNFAHIVSHNLRIHTANMLGILMALEMEDSETYQNPFVQMLKQSSDNLEKTIRHLNQVLNINNVNDLKFETINLNMVIEKAVLGIDHIYKKPDVEIINEIQHNNLVRAVPVFLESILITLLSNAVRFRSKERESYVRLSAEREGTYTVISIEDNGIGIDLNQHGEKLFGMYTKLHEGYQTKGLGLFFAKNQVEAMGGYIQVESEVNVGSTFKIYLPYEASK